jgi:hypothetical protein
MQLGCEAARYSHACTERKLPFIAQAAMWGTCGSTSSDPATCCPMGAACKYQNSTRWRCEPDFSSAPAVAPRVSLVASSDGPAQQLTPALPRAPAVPQQMPG